MEPLCISSKESSDNCGPSSDAGQQEGREMETTEIKEEPCKETEELLANVDPSAAEKKLLGEHGKLDVAPASSDICAVQGLPPESEEVSNDIDELVSTRR